MSNGSAHADLEARVFRLEHARTQEAAELLAEFRAVRAELRAWKEQITAELQRLYGDLTKRKTRRSRTGI